MKILLVEPNFPIPKKSKNHKNFLPIGLLKLASLYRQKGHEVKLIRGNKTQDEILANGTSSWHTPDEILVTSLFTYWSSCVKESVDHYRILFPNTPISVGGIYASLMPNHCKEYTKCDKVIRGIVKEAELLSPAYDLLNDPDLPSIDYQIIHTSRGCIRKCTFCGTWVIEPKFSYKSTIKDEIVAKNIVFYDNNLLANPHIEKILTELAELKKRKAILWCDAQSGLDGRILLEKPFLAQMLKKAGFRNVRIAWDGVCEEHPKIKQQIDLLTSAGFSRLKAIYIFVLYNWDLSFEDMEFKRIKCLEWGVQIADCRYRPLDQVYDRFNSAKVQTSDDYYIHPKWTDELVKQYKRNVRRQNICVRHRFIFYSREFEKKRLEKQFISQVLTQVKNLDSVSEVKEYLDGLNIRYWLPYEITYSTKSKREAQITKAKLSAPLF